jgi:hypothetical protein
LHAAQAAQKFAAIGGEAVKSPAGDSERDALTKFRMPWVARQQRLAALVKIRDDVLSPGFARDTQHPLGIVGGGDAAGRWWRS